MRFYQIKIEWVIKDTREKHYGFRLGTSKFTVKAKNQIEAINEIIVNVKQLPNWELDKNGVDLDEFREGKTSRYYYEIEIVKVLSIKAL